MRARLLSIAIAITLAGCAGDNIAPPSSEELAVADHGAPPAPDKIEGIVKEAVGRNLIDPYSAMYTFSEAKKGWWWNVDKQKMFGYIVCGTVNAKNRLGGYVGSEPYIAFIKNDQGGARTGSIRTVGGEAIVNKCNAPMSGPFMPTMGF